MSRTALILIALGSVGCAHRPGVFRLTAPAHGGSATLIPPDAKDATVVRALLPVGSIPKKTICGPSPHGLMIERKGGGRLVVTREAIAATTPAELFAWTLALEKQGCIAANEALPLGERIIDALPLDLNKRTQLLQGRGDLKPVNSLRVVAPVFKPGTSAQTGPLAEIASVQQGASPGSVDVEVKPNPAVIGYEIDWYDFVGHAGGPGYRIVPRLAELHVDGKVENRAVPSVSRFQFADAARWYELYMMTKVSANDFDFVVFSAKTSDELQKSVTAFQTDASAFLKTADPTTYTVLPHGSGINAYIRVKVNGVALDLPRGNTIRQAFAQAGTDSSTVLPRLRVQKLHDGKLYPVEWDRQTDQILSLPLEGGEEIDTASVR